SATGFSEWQAKQGAKGGRVSKRPTQTGKSKSELQPEVIKLKGQGYSNRDIAQDLGISASTVSLYLKEAF
ncbi:LuxR C-terminal-related transcriptional regulator, partial [Pseudoalteromonas sp. 45-MNA-CIBAN-0466]